MKHVAALCLLVASACGGGDRQGLTADSAVLQSGGAPADSGGGTTATGVDSNVSDTVAVDSAGLHNPTVVLAADSVTGDALFRRKGKCLSCHGLDGKGLDGLGPNLQDSVWLHGDGSFAFVHRTITEGIARPKVSNLTMPALGTTLSPEEIYHIAAYVYTLSHPGSAVADTTTIVRDTSAAPPDSVVPVPPPAAASASGASARPDTPFIR